MKRRRNTLSPVALDAAVEALGGALVVLGPDLEIVFATPSAAALMAAELPPGAPALQALCGGTTDRPVAKALARGLPFTGSIARAKVHVRAEPLERQGERSGWLLQLEREAEQGPGAPVLFSGLWTRSADMKHVFHIVQRAALRDVTVLIRGETGTGKELVARALHERSPRARGPFDAINCAAVPASLLESELFGHVRGAFTGATRDTPGFFRSAQKGTVFLDELGEMPLDLQAKLLRVLETRTVIPVGGREPIPVDVRVVAATHQSLRKAVAEGRFRADLMYRLRVVPIFLPPLRQRPCDIGLLVHKRIEELNALGGRRVARVSPAALSALERYPWPGNVRELRNALEYAYVIGEGPVLELRDLPAELESPALDIDDPHPAAAQGSSVVHSAPVPPQSGEAERIRQALERARGHRERAAASLGLSRVTLWRRMKALGIDAQ